MGSPSWVGFTVERVMDALGVLMSRKFVVDPESSTVIQPSDMVHGDIFTTSSGSQLEVSVSYVDGSSCAEVSFVEPSSGRTWGAFPIPVKAGADEP